MKYILYIISIFYLSFSPSQAHEDGPEIIISFIEGKEILTLPTDEFLSRGKTLNTGDQFTFDLEKITLAAKNEGKRIKNFKEKFDVSQLLMRAYPNAAGRKWFFQIILVDEDGNIASIIVNSNGEAFPFGKYVDPFE